MAKNRGLGKGLDLIFEDNSLSDETKESGVRTLRISAIDPKSDQPRKNFDAESLAQLAESVAANGILQPILVREAGERYEIIAGERRYRAARLAGLTEVPALVLDADDLTAAKYALIENLQRENLNPYEEAQAYRQLIDEYKLTQDEIGAQLGKSRSAVANALRLLDLPDEIKEMLINGTLSAGHARTLLGLRNKADVLPLAQKCINRNLSVRETEVLVKKLNKHYLKIQDEEDNSGEEPLHVDYFASLETRFTAATGRRCRITETKNRKTFQLEYRDNEDLENILRNLAGRDFFDSY
ncbi:MAG: ParB/RepB/Spo0J family partition protein [Ruminococcaceae bacterium]|nr:ParB/RepB/Spo0J family partition protein [Oscillospiraceae bacterium]